MKECKYCGTQYQNSLEACPNCGASAVLTPEEKVTPEKQYENVKKKVERGRKGKIAIAAISLLLVVAIVMGLATILLDDGSKEVIAATGMDKVEIKNIYAAGEAYMEQGDYANAAREFTKVSGYRDATNLSDKAIANYKVEILEQAQTYSDSGQYTEALALLDEAVATFGSDAEYDIKANAIKDVYTVALMAQADEKEKSEDYAGALELLQMASGYAPQNAEVTQKITEVTTVYKVSFFSEVDSLVAQKNFTQALATLQSIQDVFGNDPEISQKITATHKAKVLDKLPQYEDAKDYTGAIAYIKAELINTNNDPEVVTKLNTYIATYKANTLEQAATLLESDDYESAISLLKASLNTLNNDSEVLATIEEYETYKPVDLATLYIVQGENYLEAIGSTVYDNYGNTYTSGYCVQSWDTEISAVYLLNGEYTQIDGTIALPEDRKNTVFENWIEFFDGDRLIGKTNMITSGTKPESFSYDISGVQELTVRFCASKYSTAWNMGVNFLTPGIFVNR